MSQAITKSLADNAILVLSSRLMGIFGVPVALGFFWLAIGSIEKINTQLTNITVKLAVLEATTTITNRDMEHYGRRLDNLESNSRSQRDIQ